MKSPDIEVIVVESILSFEWSGGPKGSLGWCNLISWLSLSREVGVAKSKVARAGERDPGAVAERESGIALREGCGDAPRLGSGEDGGKREKQGDLALGEGEVARRVGLSRLSLEAEYSGY